MEAEGQAGWAFVLPTRTSDSSPASVTQDYTVRNNIIRHVGGGVSIRGITFLSRTLGIFSQEGTCGTLAPGESCILSVKFSPPYRGLIQGIMKIYSNASNTKGTQVRVKGAGF